MILRRRCHLSIVTPCFLLPDFAVDVYHEKVIRAIVFPSRLAGETMPPNHVYYVLTRFSMECCDMWVCACSISRSASTISAQQRRRFHKAKIVRKMHAHAAVFTNERITHPEMMRGGAQANEPAPWIGRETNAAGLIKPVRTRKRQASSGKAGTRVEVTPGDNPGHSRKCPSSHADAAILRRI